mgnify:CR=1 FL=1
MKGFETNNYSVKETIMSLGYNGIKAHSLISALLIYNLNTKIEQQIRI